MKPALDDMSVREYGRKFLNAAHGCVAGMMMTGVLLDDDPGDLDVPEEALWLPGDLEMRLGDAAHRLAPMTGEILRLGEAGCAALDELRRVLDNTPGDYGDREFLRGGTFDDCYRFVTDPLDVAGCYAAALEVAWKKARAADPEPAPSES